jgi:DNA-binding NtrC family response regulator
VGEAHRRTATPPFAFTAELEAHPTVLLTLPAGAQTRLRPYLAECGAQVLTAASCEEARHILASNPEVDAIFTEILLADGCFAGLVEAGCDGGESRVPVVVCLEHLDAGCTDLLERGAYSILSPPYSAEKVRWLISECAHARKAAQPAV